MSKQRQHARIKTILKPNHNAKTDAALKAACDRIDHIIACAEKWRKVLDERREFLRKNPFPKPSYWKFHFCAVQTAGLALYNAVGATGGEISTAPRAHKCKKCGDTMIPVCQGCGEEVS